VIAQNLQSQLGKHKEMQTLALRKQIMGTKYRKGALSKEI
jgi:hypothetical protein